MDDVGGLAGLDRAALVAGGAERVAEADAAPSAVFWKAGSMLSSYRVWGVEYATRSIEPESLDEPPHATAAMAMTSGITPAATFFHAPGPLFLATFIKVFLPFLSRLVVKARRGRVAQR